MAEGRTGQMLVWVGAGLLVLMLFMSMTGHGTWMGGVGMGWMMVVPVVVLLLVVGAAYRFGRMEQKVEELEKERKL